MKQQLLNIIQNFRSRDEDFQPYYSKENSFKRLSVLYGIVAFVIAPIYSYLINNDEVSKMYFYIGLTFCFLFPIYIFICWYFKSMRDKLIYFFIFHLFGIAYLGFIDLVEHSFNHMDFFCFFSLYAASVFVVQRIYPVIIYTIYVLGLLLFGYQFVDNPEISTVTSFTLFGMLGVCSILMLYSRERMINSVEDYSNYLKKIMNNPGIGYVLINFEGEKIHVIDYNQESIGLLSLNEGNLNSLEVSLQSNLTEQDITQINGLSKQDDFIKYILIDGAKTIEVKVSIVNLKNGLFWLVCLTNITKRIKEKEELVLREEKYRNLYYKNQAGVFTLDRDTKLVDFNETFYLMFGGSFEKGDYFIKQEYLEEWEELYDIISNKQNLKNYQTHFTLNNGSVKWFVFNYFYDIKTTLIEGTVVDVTDVQKTSIALSQSEEKYRLIYEESNDAILLLDDDDIIDINRKGIQLFGISEDEMLTKTLWELSHDTSEEFEKKYKKIKQKLQLSKSTKFNWNFQGNTQIIEAEVAIVELNVGDKLYHQCVIHDVTLKNATMRALEENKRSFQSILDNNPEGMIIIDKEVVLYANKEAYKLYGSETIDINDLFEEQIIFFELLEKQRIEKTQQQRQFNLVGKSGNNILVDVTLVTTNFSKNDAILIIVKDISLQNKLSKEVLRAEIAEETNKKLEKEISNRRKAEKELENLLLKTKAIYDSSENTLLLTINLENCITSFNSHSDNYFYSITQHRMKRGRHMSEYFDSIFDRRDLRYFELIIDKVKGGFSHQVESKFVKNGQTFWLELFINPIFDSEGKISEISLVAHDITEKKFNEKGIVDSLKEKEVLLKEIHHRVKNNLQVISSILNLQSSFIQDEKMLDVLQESRNRIRSMAIIHEDLYRTTNFASIDFANYILNLATNLVSLYRLSEENVELRYDLESIDLVLDQAVPCGLLVNEIIANAVKYAFPDNGKGEIFIQLKEINGWVELLVKDNGIGLPQDFEIETSDTLGLQLVLTLVDQLDGEIAYSGKNGTEFLIKFEKTKL